MPWNINENWGLCMWSPIDVARWCPLMEKNHLQGITYTTASTNVGQDH